MPKEYDSYRGVLEDLVYAMGSFTEDELKQRFTALQKRAGEIERFQSIHEYLDDLGQSGVLGFQDGRYHVLRRSHPQKQCSSLVT